MKLDKFTEQEFLDLLKKTEEEIYEFLDSKENKKHVFEYTECTHTCTICDESMTCFCVESLADLAERLWEKAVEKVGTKLVSYLSESIDKFDTPEFILKSGRSMACEWKVWWLFYAKPIHRIVASLITLQRSGAKI